MHHQANLWYVRTARVRDPKLLDSYLALLSPDEMARYERFFFDRDRHLHVVAHALVRTMLSSYADVAPADWRFRANRHGRPEIEGPSTAPELRFNLSHTNGLVACIVATGVDVGVDVEDRRRRTPGPAIARRFFSAAEVAAFERLPVERQKTVFYEYWTLKEAYIKAVGIGISLGLGRFAFDLDERGAPVGDPERRPPRVSFDAELDDDPRAWQFAQYEPTAHHAMAAAIRRGEGRDLEIRVREVIPGRYDDP